MSFAFSDGYPIYEISAFLIIFAMASVLASTKYAGTQIGALLDRAGAFTRRCGALNIFDLPVEYRRIDIARILLGGLATSRYMEIYAATTPGSISWALSGIALILSFFVTVGFLTPLACFALMASANTVIDNYLGASTLGTMVLSISLLCLTLAPAGQTYSIDALLQRTMPRFSRPVHALYRVLGGISANRVAIAKMAAILAYWMLCLYSVIWHLRDEAWMSGNVIGWIMIAPTANPRFSDLTLLFYEWWPAAYVILSRIAIYGMIAWYALFLPGLFMGRTIRLAVILWGLAFFLISAIVLPLRSLGWYELAMWLLLFLNGPFIGSTTRPRIVMLFDDRCNLCDRTVKLLARLDIFFVAEFRPIRPNIDYAAQHGVTLEEGLTDIVGILPASGRRLQGFNLYNYLCGHFIVLWPLMPFFMLGKITGLGSVIYRWVAERRTRLFGVCEFSTIPNVYRSPSQNIVERRQAAASSGPRIYKPLTTGLLITTVIMAGIFAVRLPVLTSFPDHQPPGIWSKQIFGQAPLALGIGKINVFNQPDLATMRLKAEIRWDIDPLHTATSSFHLGAPFALKNYMRTQSDQQVYGALGEKRRMSRMNLFCDRRFFEHYITIASSLFRSDIAPPEIGVMTYENLFEVWPTAADFDSFLFAPPQQAALCTAHLDLRKKEVASLIFHQEGVDAVMQHKNLPPFIQASGAEAATSFPCKQEAAYTGKYFDMLAATHPKKDAIADLLRGMSNRPYGKFQIWCAAQAHVIQKDFDLDWGAGNPPPNVKDCDIDLAAAQAYRNALPEDARPSADLRLQAAENAAKAGDMTSCVLDAAAIRRSYWNIIRKQSMPTPVPPLTNEHKAS